MSLNKSLAPRSAEAKRPLKIVFFMTTILEHGGGLEKYYIETAGHLARQGFDVDVITMDERYTVRIANLLSVFYGRRMDPKLSHKLKSADIQDRLAPAKYRQIIGFKRLRQALNEYDVVYSKNELIEAFILKYFVGFRRIPPVMFGGHTPLSYPRATTFHAKLHNALYTGAIYRHLASEVSGFHCLNTYEDGLYRKLFPDRPVSKIYNPFDLSAYRKMASSISRPIEADPRRTNILWVGRLTEQKGVDRLCALIEKTPTDIESLIMWHIVGNGELKESLDQIARRHTNVRIYGYIDATDMPNVYRDADIFIFTSKWEGYPYTLLEASSFEIPILAFSIPGVTDILGKYPPGKTVEDADEFYRELISLIRSKPDRSLQRNESPKNEFSPTVVYQRLLHALGEIA